jgi:acetate kinase
MTTSPHASFPGPAVRAESPCILTINGGSSTLRFAIYQTGEGLRLLLQGKVDRIGASDTRWLVRDAGGSTLDELELGVADFSAAADHLLGWLEGQPAFPSIKAVAHRVVHGLSHTAPTRVTPKLLAELHQIAAFDPQHLPFEIALIADFAKRHPGLPQIACFDTAFHRTMPEIARRLPIPRQYQDQGIERYGFHGLSYAYLMDELVRLGDPAATQGRVILAHLGNGASIAAVRDGKCIDTSMGFTPTSGLMMSTRAGDLDPGLGYYLAQAEHMTAAQFQHMVTQASGLLGVSETSADVRDLLAREADDARAAEALAMFCYQAKKWLGAYIAALGGIDTLVFAGGIGENAPVIRARICAGLEFLGIRIQSAHNAASAAVISAPGGRTTVRVIRTNEELMLARLAAPFLDTTHGN